ncbi:hypothetical protein R3X27_18385 [Tropicimonas sp. TH_r6]|uniref:hypothetical protein n=1 Tax=Tropicimonas sp. TH_r6 TaxID=3082085 RepID=UPI0029553C6C|nr:hypothetical protein [Tropicimonas sp. TH_r6]MDV7144652.1 hypothetical protein [Tropicimonas sp. TH_r6]
MLARLAIFRGTLPDENRAEFVAHLNARMLPLIRDFPAILSADALLPVSGDPSLSDVQLILDMRYEDEAGMLAALASPQRARNGEETQTLLALMSEPSVEHIVLSL